MGDRDPLKVAEALWVVWEPIKCHLLNLKRPKNLLDNLSQKLTHQSNLKDHKSFGTTSKAFCQPIKI